MLCSKCGKSDHYCDSDYCADCGTALYPYCGECGGRIMYADEDHECSADTEDDQDETVAFSDSIGKNVLSNKREIDPVSYITAAWLRIKPISGLLWHIDGPGFLKEIWDLEEAIADINVVHRWLREQEGTIDSIDS